MKHSHNQAIYRRFIGMTMSAKVRPLRMTIVDDVITVSLEDETLGTIPVEEFIAMTTHEIMNRLGVEIDDTKY